MIAPSPTLALLDLFVGVPVSATPDGEMGDGGLGMSLETPAGFAGTLANSLSASESPLADEDIAGELSEEPGAAVGEFGVLMLAGNPPQVLGPDTTVGSLPPNPVLSGSTPASVESLADVGAAPVAMPAVAVGETPTATPVDAAPNSPGPGIPATVVAGPQIPAALAPTVDAPVSTVAPKPTGAQIEMSPPASQAAAVGTDMQSRGATPISGQAPVMSEAPAEQTDPVSPEPSAPKESAPRRPVPVMPNVPAAPSLQTPETVDPSFRTAGAASPLASADAGSELHFDDAPAGEATQNSATSRETLAALRPVAASLRVEQPSPRPSRPGVLPGATLRMGELGDVARRLAIDVDERMMASQNSTRAGAPVAEAPATLAPVVAAMGTDAAVVELSGDHRPVDKANGGESAVDRTGMPVSAGLAMDVRSEGFASSGDSTQQDEEASKGMLSPPAVPPVVPATTSAGAPVFTAVHASAPTLHQSAQQAIADTIVRMGEDQLLASVTPRRATVELTPKHLGRVQIEVVQQANRSVEVHLTAATRAAQTLLEGDADDLVDHLRSHSIDVSKVDVKGDGDGSNARGRELLRDRPAQDQAADTRRDGRQGRQSSRQATADFTDYRYWEAIR